MKRHTALDQAIHLMESDPHLALNSGKLQGLRPDGHTPGLYWYLGPAERLTLPVDNYVHIVYRDLNQKVQVSLGFYGYAPLRQVIPEHPLNHLFKFRAFCLIAVAPRLYCPSPMRGLGYYKPKPLKASELFF